jgi:hypothetical protein
MKPQEQFTGSFYIQSKKREDIVAKHSIGLIEDPFIALQQSVNSKQDLT